MNSWTVLSSNKVNTVLPEGFKLKLDILVKLCCSLAHLNSMLVHVKELLWTQVFEQYRKHDVLTQVEVMDLLDEIWCVNLMWYSDNFIVTFFWPVYLLILSASAGESTYQEQMLICKPLFQFWMCIAHWDHSLCFQHYSNPCVHFFLLQKKYGYVLWGLIDYMDF